MNKIAFSIIVVSMFACMLITTSNALKPLEDKPLNGNCDDVDELGHLNIAALYPEADRIQQYQYYNCSSVKSVTFPDAIFSIGQEAFSLCKNLEVVNFGSDSKLNQIAIQAFLRTGIKDFVVPPLVKAVMYEAFNGASLKSFTFQKPCDSESNQNIQFFSGALGFNPRLKSIEVPKTAVLPEEGVQDIGVKVTYCP
jgi:hypothetical protein